MLQSSSSPVRDQDFRRQEMLAAQVGLLYANANSGIAVTILAATVLACLQWGIVANSTIASWWLYMAAISVARYTLAGRYRAASSDQAEMATWLNHFAIGAGLAGAGWGAAGIVLYPEAHLTNQVSLVFVLGGMMLGAASLLSPRPEAFLAFLIPTGLGPAVRLLLQGDGTHFAMGLLAAVFTLVSVLTTYRMYRTVRSSLSLQFENRDLVEGLVHAKNQTEALNQALESKVRERTAELLQSTEQLRAEISQREKTEEELLRARKLESLGVLAGGIAHDFNNFLTIVQGNIELARAYMSPGDPVLNNLDQTADACRRAAFLSSQLLTFAKGGAPVRHVVSVGKLVTDAVQLARAGAPISVSVHVAEDLRCAHVDPDQIGQVLHNILLNARQSMTEGGIIEVRAENTVVAPHGDAEFRVRITIRDYGCGIAADVLPRIFDPYFTTKPGRSGLGLATAYAIVAKHGGHIAVESKPGVGTAFFIDLPAPQERPAAEVPEFLRSSDTLGGTERVLVMDDEEAIRNLLKAVLGGFGYEVHTARDGAEAIALYERAKAAGKGFDVALLDLTVSGGMGGIEAAAKLKELEPSFKLIVSSGYADAPVMSDFAKFGFDGVIPKPWTSKVVREVFQRVLRPVPDRKMD